MEPSKNECREPTWKQFIRPITFIITLLIFFIIMLLDGNWNEFQIRDIYLKILESILVTMVIALFTSRGVEKTFDIIKSKQEPQKENERPYDYRDYDQQNKYQEDEPDIYKKYKNKK